MAAVEADRVIVALIGDTKGLDGPVNSSATQFDRNMSKIEASATRAERQIVRSAGAIAAGQRNLGRQFADVGAQLSGGQSPFLILAQQLPQVADAATDMGGKLGKVASFLTTPWGAAALAATSVLVPLVAGLFKTGNEVDALVEKMRQQARQAENNRAADNAWRITIEGVTEAIRKRREEQEKSLKTDQQAEQQALANARGELVTQRDNLAQAQRDLVKAQRLAAELRRQAADPNAEGTSESNTTVYETAQRRVEALRTKVANLRRSVAEAEASVRGAEIPIGQREVAGRIDAAVAATNAYTAAEGRLNDKKVAGLITQKQYNAELEKEARKRDAAIKAAQEAAKATEKVTLALPANGRITSGFGNRARPTAGASTYHPAIDIGVPVGSPVSAGASGVVVYAGNLKGFGKAVIIDYGAGTIAQFSHLSALKASQGDAVASGQVVALSGNSGISTGPHLDYRLRTGARVENGRVVGGQYVDPRKPVRIGAGDAAANAEDAAAKAQRDREQIASDFQKLMDDLEREGEQASNKIASDFSAIEEGIDPAAKIAHDLQETLNKIEKARLTGIVDDARAAELQLKATHRAAADLLGNVIHIDDLRAGGEVEQRELDDADDKRKQAEDKAQDQRREHVSQLADLYESLFYGGTASIWDEFKRQGLRALALLAAQETFKAITGNSVGLAAGGGGIFGSLFGAIFGRASGGYVGPGSVHRINEHKGGVELLRMGPQGGEVIPLGQASANPRAGSVTVIQNFTLDARGGITTPQLLKGVNALVDQKAGMARDQAVAITRGAIPGDLAKAQRYER